MTTFRSLEELVRTVIDHYHRGDKESLERMLVPKDFYVDRIYPHTAEGRTPGHGSGEDFWRQVIGIRRPYNLAINIDRLKGRVVSIDSIGKPKHVVEFGPYRYLRHVAVTLKVRTHRGNVETVTNDDIIGVVIYDKTTGDYMFMNTFK